MATVALTKDTFADTVGRDGIVLVDGWAGWCGGCRMFAPVFERSSDRHPDITFGKVDTVAEPEIAAVARITFLPTLMAFRDSVLVLTRPGVMAAAALEQLINVLRHVDVEQVRHVHADKARA